MLIESVERYLQLRHTLGFDLRHTGSLLRRFARFSSTRDETHVRTRTAIDWAQRAPSPGGRDRRLKTVIRFARHVHAEDSGHEIPPDGVFGRHRQRRLPFLFTPADVSRILKQAMSLGPHGSMRWWRKPGSSPVPGNGRLTSMGCATVLPSEHWKPLPATGIRSLAICWPCLRTSGMLTLPTPTGTCRSRPSC